MTAGELDLSATPLTLRISLTRGADFVRRIEPLDADLTPSTFTDGTQLVLDFGEHGTWPATVTPTAADWNVDKVVVDALIDALPFGARCVLRYRLGDADLTWAAGTVQSNG